MTIRNQEALNERANNLEGQNLNGLRLVLVTLYPDTNPTEAHLEVHFYNNKELSNILSDPKDPKLFFPILGGHRMPAGPGAGQVKVISISGNQDDSFLRLTVAPIGDYSTYTLRVDYQNIDPIFNEIEFKFRPGCFSINCAPDWKPALEPKEEPAIDYLAKDYDSFRHTMITTMMEHVPGWQPTSEADLDQVLLELFSAAADELSDYQDRVMNEAYLGTARKRVSLVRHARLMDYHIHQGNQASTWLALEASTLHTLPKGFLVGTDKDLKALSSVVFVTHQSQVVNPLLNDISLYTWSDSIPALAAGNTGADLKLSTGGQTVAETVRDLIRNGTVSHLLIQEHLNPLTGKVPGRDPTKRQLLKLISGGEGAKAAKASEDPMTGEWFVRVYWEELDKLKSSFCFTIDCPDGKVEDVSLFHGNLVQVYHGRRKSVIFKEQGAPLAMAVDPDDPEELYYEKTKEGRVICRLPEGPLAYEDRPPGGEMSPKSTLAVVVEVNGNKDSWDEAISLIHSDDSDEKGDHFVVENDEERQSSIRFGNGVNGKKLPEDAVVHCSCQIGRGLDGNVGADRLQHFDSTVFSELISFGLLVGCWNPFDVTNGRNPEPVAEVVRCAPEAYRYRQLRAITIKDYIDRVEELPEVSRASARYMWTGSWRTVRVAIDPVGTTTVTEKLREKVARHLEAVRLIGEDIELRSPRFVPLEITVSLCIHKDYWPEDTKFILEQEFSDGFTPGGRMAFFRPDLWTFGQALHASQIIGRVQSLKGVDHVVGMTMKRWNEVTPGTVDIIEVQPNEIIQVKNDPDHMERGFITFDLKGGRQ